MQLKKIIAGKWYRTRAGTGQVLRVGGTHPPSVQINIVLPFPRGTVYVVARDVLEEVPAPNQEEDDEDAAEDCCCCSDD
jgi:hypothetical protein